MKNLFAVLFFSFLLFSGFTSYSQCKCKSGYVDVEEILAVIPDKKNAEEEFQKYSKGLADQLDYLEVEFNKKLKDYQSLAENISPLVKQDKEKELQDLNQRIQGFKTQANIDMQMKNDELLKPIVEKVEVAIKDVGKEEKFFDIKDKKSLLFFSEEYIDVTPLVKKKLGITATEATTNNK